MSLLRSILIKLGLANFKAERAPISVFLLDDDRRRHRWFEKRLTCFRVQEIVTVFSFFHSNSTFLGNLEGMHGCFVEYSSFSTNLLFRISKDVFSVDFVTTWLIKGVNVHS